MATKFFAYSEENTLISKLMGVLVGDLMASGYFSIKLFFDMVPKIRILAGINIYLPVAQKGDNQKTNFSCFVIA